MEEAQTKFGSVWQDHVAKVEAIVKARRVEEEYFEVCWHRALILTNLFYVSF